MTTISSNRITGLATGLDTDQLVKDMLTSEQNKLDRVKQQQTLTEWKQEEYREIITDAKSLYSKYFDPLSKDYLLGSNSFSTTSISSSNNSVITATAGAGSLPANYNFEVKSTATTAQINSSVTVAKNDKLGDLGLSGETSFQINYGDGKSTSTITISEDDTISSLVDKINKASGGNVKATFSEMTGKFSITSSTTGESSKISISSGMVEADGTFTANGSSDALSFLGIDGAEVSGKNVNVIVTDSNGNLIKEISSEKNVFAIDGVTYNVNGVGSATLTSSTDTTSAVDKMNSFIEDYNKLVDRIYTNLTEKKNSDYPPLTDAQKKEMTKEEIENWEEKAKQGMLRGDSELRNMLDNLNATFSGTLAEFGVTLSTDYTKQGQLVLDEEKFKNALVENGDKVFDAVTSTLEKTKDVFKNNVGSSSSILVKKAGLQNTVSYTNNLFSEEIKRYETKAKELARKMTAKENALYKKFASLESIMNKFNSQMNYFYSM